MTSKIETFALNTLTQDSGDCSMEDSTREPCRDPLAFLVPLHHKDSSQTPRNSLASSFLHRVMTKPLSPTTMTKTIPTTTSRNLLDSVPKEVLARDILGFLTDKGVKVFFDTLGEERIQSPTFSDIRNQFCQKHGSKLEDPNTFFTSNENDDNNTATKPRGILSKPTSQRCCPECHAEQQKAKRCHGCKVFYPASRDASNTNNKAFPGLWCQSCDHMAFCKDCLSNESGGCGSAALATTMLQQAPLFGRKHRLGNKNNNNSQSHRYNGRASCHNYCCPNVFTNTMCGEFVCFDCGDENQKLLRDKKDSGDEHLAIETCEECGKSTCLDSNCLVCADFKLIHMSCKFSPEDAYNVDIGNLSPRLRRNLSDCLVLILVLMALSKMWWFQKQQQEQEL